MAKCGLLVENGVSVQKLTESCAHGSVVTTLRTPHDRSGRSKGSVPAIKHKHSIVRHQQFCATRACEFAGGGGELGGLFMQGPGVFLTGPLMAVAGVVAGSFLILLDEPGVVHGAKLADEDGFGFLVEFGGVCHGSETKEIGGRFRPGIS